MSDRGIAMMLLYTLFSLILSGVVALSFSGTKSRYARAIVGLGLFGFSVGLIVSWLNVVESGFRSKGWSVGWVVPDAEQTTIKVGVALDPIGFGACALFAFLGVLLLLNGDLEKRKIRTERACSAMAFSVAGVCLSWISATPWLCFVGLSVAILGGFCSYFDAEFAGGEKAKLDSKGFELAPRFLLERSSGLLFSFIGALMLLGGGASVSWIHEQAWSGDSIIKMGTGFLCLGLFLQFGSVPVLDVSVSRGGASSFGRLITSSLSPGWAAMALVFRLSNHIGEIALLTVFAWVCAVAAALSFISGLFQPEWKRSLGAYVPSVFCAAIAALGFGSPLISYGLLVGTTLGVVALFLVGQMTTGANEETQRSKGKTSTAWFVIVAGLSASMCGGGVFGVAHWGLTAWLQQASEPAALVASAIVVFLQIFLSWRIAWMLIAVRSVGTPSIVGLISVTLCLFGGISFFWTGEFTGLGLFGWQDGGPRPLLERMFLVSLPSVAVTREFTAQAGIAWVYLGLVVFGVLSSFWMRKTWVRVFKGATKLSLFVATGYGGSKVLSASVSRLVEWGGWQERFVAERLWVDGIVRPVSRLLSFFSRVVILGDRWLLTRSGSFFDRVLSGSIRVPQLIQNGDSQWYLFFAVGSTLLVLIKLLLN